MEGTVDQSPVISEPVRGTLPSSKPTNTPDHGTPEPTVATTDEPSYKPTETPAQQPTGEPSQDQPTVQPQQTDTPTAEPTRAPEQTQPPAQTQAPVQPTQEPTPEPTKVQEQPENRTTSNGDGTYKHNFSDGWVLATTESNNNNDPVYHTKDCQAAKKILPENELWYQSAQAAQEAGRRLCGYCGR